MARNRTLTALAALSAASWLALATPAAAKEQLVIGIAQFPANFHPNIESMVAKTYILDMARRPFTTFDQDWRLICMLCTELPSLEKGTAREVVHPDGRRTIDATFTIRPDATWGDGTPVTTKDVLFTWEVGRHPQSGFSNAALYKDDIENITAVDDKTFIIHWSKYLCDYNKINDLRLLPAHLERPVFEANPTEYRNRSLYETDTTNPGLYFGPYRITRVDRGASVALEPNPTWWGKKPGFKRIVVRAIENTAALEADLLSGGIDYIAGENGLTLDQALAFEQRHGDRYKVVHKPGLVYEHLDVNLDNPALSDRRVRQALLHGLDRESITQKLFSGKQPVSHNTINPLDRVHSPGYPTYAYDVAQANKLLDEAGWTDKRNGIRHKDGQPLRVTLMTTAGNRTRELVQQVIQSQWRQIGVDTVIENQPARVLFGETLKERKFPALALFAWITSPENIPKTTLHSTMIPTAENGWAGQNYPGFRNAEMDKVIDALEVTCKESERQPLWAKLQQIYAQELPALPLYFRADSFIMPHWLEGVRPTGHQYSSSQWAEEWHAKP